MTTPAFAAHVAGTEPAPFDWAVHDAMMAERSAALAKALDAWRETARTFMQFDPLAPELRAARMADVLGEG